MNKWLRAGALPTVEFLLVASAALLAVVPLPPALVESWYSTGLYPHIQRTLTPLSNAAPFAFLDILIVAAAVGMCLPLGRAIGRAWRSRTLTPIVRTVAHLLAAVAGIYVLFLLLWGLNYRRIRMPERLELDRAAPTTEEVVQLGLKAAGEMNVLYSAAHQPNTIPEWKDPALRSAYVTVQRMLSGALLAEPGRLKRSLLGPYFRWTGVDGMVNPFGLEVIANPDLLPFERSFIAAHEWGHLAGYADEAEANFVGWLTCIRGTPAQQYSGWFYVFWQINGELGAQERGRLNGALAEGPRRDVNAVIARLRGGEIPALQHASWQVYDKYLKANRVEAGVRSYGEVVTLLIRARFGPGWTPARRGSSAPAR